MKTALTKFFAAIFLFTLAVTPLRAQTNASAENETNSPVAVTNSVQASNAFATTQTRHKKKYSSNESSPIRIDSSGIHIGGSDPVDIDISHGGPILGISAMVLMALVPLAPFMMVIAVMAIMFYTIHRRNKMVHDNLRAMIEKGVPITPELIAQLRNKHSGFSNFSSQLGQQVGRPRQRHLLPGLILTGVGTALLIITSGHHSSGGWIVLFIGVAFLIVWFVERTDKNNDQPPKQ